MGLELDTLQINTLREIIADGKITDDEKKKAEKEKINQELIEELQTKSPEEINDYFEKLLVTKQIEQAPQNSTPWYRKLLSGIVGGAVGLYTASKLFKGCKAKIIGGLIGVGAALIIDGLLSTNKKEPIPATHERVQCKANVTPAFTYTVESGDNMSKIARKNNVSLSRMRKVNTIEDENKIQIGQQIQVPESYSIDGLKIECNLQSVSEYSGASVNYLHDIIDGLECQNKGPQLKAYYDGVKDDKHPKGHLTIGFGHTGNVNGEKIKEDTKITEEQAYRLLSYDVLSARAEAITFLGEKFLDAPQSIQDAIIDIAYNKDSEKVFDGIERDKNGKIINDNFISETRKLKEDIQNGDYVSAAKHVIYNTDNLGLKKRNVYRIITAIRDLPLEAKTEVLNATEAYYLETKEALGKDYPTDARILEKAWTEAHKGNCTNFFC